MKRQASVGMFYLWTILIITAILFLTSCGSAKSCHTKKYHVDKSIKKAQGRSSAYRN
jgi:hypothetical protein